MAMVMREVNDLGFTLQRQRTEAVESTALLTHVMEEIGVAVFAFDPTNQLLLVNKAGEAAGRQAERRARRPAGVGARVRRVPRRRAAPAGRSRVRRPARPLRSAARACSTATAGPHHLVVLADLSQALREEEQAAWQRIVRVLSHEINNSLTPIKSIAHSLRRIVDRAPEFQRSDEVQQGLSLIEERSGALGRFLRSYAQLARLPKPNPRIGRRARAGHPDRRARKAPARGRAAVAGSVQLVADSDQLEQLLINVIRNAVDASLETGGGVAIGWKRAGDWFELNIDDEGKGLPDTSNLFVPFFTTKPNGSGIGLALSRQIAEAHGGTISLENRHAGSGCRATLRLPTGALANRQSAIGNR